MSCQRAVYQWTEVVTTYHGKRASRAGKSEELGEIGDLPASPFPFHFQGAFAGIGA
jgi:hypothetical protein